MWDAAAATGSVHGVTSDIRSSGTVMPREPLGGAVDLGADGAGVGPVAGDGLCAVDFERADLPRVPRPSAAVYREEIERRR